MRKSNLRISVFTKMYNPHVSTNHKKVADYLKQIIEAIKIASNHKSKLLILPAHSFGEDPSPRQIDILQNEVNHTGISVIAEIGEHDTRYFSPEVEKSGRMEQHYVDSNDNKPKAEETLKDLKANRNIELENKKIGVLLCGEINILKNSNDKAKPRFSSLNFPLDKYDIWINPAHTIMGRPQHVHSKLKFLSKSKEDAIAIHCANNNTDKTEAELTIYVYKNGKQLVDGTLDNYPEHLTYKTDEWRMVTIEV